jgi:hypothetical protein
MLRHAYVLQLGAGRIKAGGCNRPISKTNLSGLRFARLAPKPSFSSVHIALAYMFPASGVSHRISPFPLAASVPSTAKYSQVVKDTSETSCITARVSRFMLDTFLLKRSPPTEAQPGGEKDVIPEVGRQCCATSRFPSYRHGLLMYSM